MDDLLALFHGKVGVPVVGDQGKSEVLGEPCSHPILLDVCSKEIDTREVSLSIFEPSDDEIVIVGILFVPAFVAHGCQVVGVLID